MLDLTMFLSKIGIANYRLRRALPASGRFGMFTSQYFRLLAHTVYLAPLIMGTAAAWLFATVPQMQEVYLGIVEDRDYGRGIAGLAAVSLFSGLLYAWNHIEVSGRIDAIYPDHADIHLDRRIFDVRDLKTAFAASLPFFGLFIGLAQVYRHVLDAGEAGLPHGALKTLSNLPGAIIAAAAITLVTYIALLALFHRFRKRTRSLKLLLYFCYGFAALLVAVPILVPDATLIASRFAGPLAGTAFVLIEAAVAVRLLFWFLQKIFSVILALPSWLLMATDGLPLGLRQAVIVLFPLIAVAALAADVILGDRSGSELEQESTVAEEANDIGPIFQAWLAERKIGSGRYPVFVVSAQGGGIYAASTAGAFLATMQDHCPAFARHVFAISAVSGGSVGASLFDAAFADSIARGTNRKAAVDVEPGCDSLFARPGELSRRLRTITQDDHISPVLAYLVPDFLRGLVRASLLWDSGKPSSKSPCGGSAWGRRDSILEESFIDSFKRSGPSSKGGDYDCPAQEERNLLARPFSDSWSEKGDVPALLLNATWVETGYRVAFAPFSLEPFGGGTLYSFNNLSQKASGPTLIEAAVISARFPALMPPWTLELGKGSRLTFVDGGYADSSGAATALQLYNKLKEVGGNTIDLYLITLTDKSKALTAAAGVEPVGSTPVRGWLYDLFSPVNTLLSVRDLQSRKAVTEARTELGEKMIVVQLDQKAFPLPLGWKLSGLSSDFIRLTIGDPARCTLAGDKGDTAVSIANRNNCELKRIVDLISPKTVTSLSLLASPAVMSPKPDGASVKPDIAGPKSVVATSKAEVASPKPSFGAWAPTAQ